VQLLTKTRRFWVILGRFGGIAWIVTTGSNGAVVLAQLWAELRQEWPKLGQFCRVAPPFVLGTLGCQW
jgi:hypothetical protein